MAITQRGQLQQGHGPGGKSSQRSLWSASDSRTSAASQSAGCSSAAVQWGLRQAGHHWKRVARRAMPACPDSRLQPALRRAIPSLPPRRRPATGTTGQNKRAAEEAAGRHERQYKSKEIVKLPRADAPMTMRWPPPNRSTPPAEERREYLVGKVTASQLPTR